jgi:hypothetical protein
LKDSFYTYFYTLESMADNAQIKSSKYFWFRLATDWNRTSGTAGSAVQPFDECRIKIFVMKIIKNLKQNLNSCKKSRKPYDFCTHCVDFTQICVWISHENFLSEFCFSFYVFLTLCWKDMTFEKETIFLFIHIFFLVFLLINLQEQEIFLHVQLFNSGVWIVILCDIRSKIDFMM